MFFVRSNLRDRHRFIEQSIEGANDALRTPQVAQRLGSYAAQLADVGSRLYVPNVRYGRLSIPKGYQDTDMVPVVAVRPQQKLRVSRDFNNFSPRQRQSATDVVRGWRPTKNTPEEFVSRLEGEVRRTSNRTGRFRQESEELATVSYNATSVSIKGTNFTNAPQKARYIVKSRPFVTMEYTDGKPFGAPIVLHEFEHVDQHEREPLVRVDSDEEEVVIDKSYELEAYHVGALCVLGLRDSGLAFPDRGDQIKINEARIDINGPDSFTYNDAIEARLAQENILHLAD